MRSITLNLLLALCFTSLISAPSYAVAQRQMSAEDIRQFKEADSWNNEVLRLQRAARYDEAINLAKRVLAVYERVLGPNHFNTATALSNLAGIYQAKGDYRSAEGLFRRALSISENVDGPNHPATASIVDSMAGLYHAQGKYENSIAFLKRAVRIREQTLGVSHQQTAHSLGNLAEVYAKIGKNSEALALLPRVIRIKQSTIGEYHASTAASISSLAGVYRALGDLKSSETYQKRSLEIRRKVLRAKHPDIASSLNNLGLLYKTQGRYASAEPMYREALQIRESTLGSNHRWTIQSRQNLAALYVDQANFVAAQPLLESAIKANENVLGRNHPDLVPSLNSLADLYRQQGKPRLAIPLLERSLTISKSVFGRENLEYTVGLNHLALAYVAITEYSKAQPLFEEALRTRKKILGGNHTRVAAIHNSLGWLYEKQGTLDLAESNLKREIAIIEPAFGTTHQRVTSSQLALARLQIVADRKAEAVLLLDRSQRGMRQHVLSVLPFLSLPRQELYRQRNYVPALSQALSFAVNNSDDPGIAKAAATWLFNGKAISHEATAHQNLLNRDVTNPAISNFVNELIRVRSRIAALAVTAPESGKDQSRRNELASLAAKEQQLVQSLGSQGNKTAATKDNWIDLKLIKSKLKADEVFVDIARFQIYNFKVTNEQTPWGKFHYFAWINRGGKAKTEIVNLGPADSIDTLVQRVREGVNDGSQIESAGEEAAFEKIHQDLDDLASKILKPLRKHLEGSKTVVLSPDGPLWLAPWGALPVDSDHKFLIEQYGLRFVTSGRDLVAAPDKRETRSPVMFANPRFEETKQSKQSSILTIVKKLPNNKRASGQTAKNLLPNVSPLPNTEVEATAIQPKIEKYSGQKPRVFKERYALEQVAKSIKNPSVVTFATHGFFLPINETKSNNASLPGADDTRSAGSKYNATKIENPLLRCGLLLTGCNNRDSVVGDDDGILTGMEITSIDFRGTELVVLSACDTGVGDIRNGEGVAGLRQAFQLAGAESVLASLWQVDDAETARLMNLFFENLAKGMTKSEALRQAQLSRIKARRARHGAAHPFFWAAFTLTGQD